MQRLLPACKRPKGTDRKSSSAGRPYVHRLGCASSLSYDTSMARILHIEDDPGNRLLVRKLLQAAGHSVTDAADGLEGVQLACAERPDLVLVDLNLPGLDGYEVTLRLRGEASLRGVPI